MLVHAAVSLVAVASFYILTKRNLKQDKYAELISLVCRGMVLHFKAERHDCSQAVAFQARLDILECFFGM